MISIIITTFKEKEILPKAIQNILDQTLINAKLTQIDAKYEILVVGPDKETEEIVKNYPQVRHLKDKGIGKPAALNLALQKARGEIFILTDGDVYVEKGAIKKLLQHFKDEKVGGVSGRPVPINSRNNLFGYWSHFLTEVAHLLRLKKSREEKYLDCSGYLYAIRNLIKEIPDNALSEDGLISQLIWQKGYKIIYEPEAKVYVKYPDNFKDWLKQKVRATGGYVQPLQIKNQYKYTNKNRMRSFWGEVSNGIKLFFIYPKNLHEFWWTILLYLARLYLWLLIFWQIKVLKKPFTKIWKRVESTK